MDDLYFEDIEIGYAGKSDTFQVSREDIINFARQFDPRPFHIDEVAAAESAFGGLAASSAHIFAVATLLSNTLAPWLKVVAGLGYEHLRFPIPMRPGDTVGFTSTVIEKRESKSRNDRGIVRATAQLSNAAGDLVFDCVGSSLWRADPALTVDDVDAVQARGRSEHS